jgi:hypothetical protein
LARTDLETNLAQAPGDSLIVTSTQAAGYVEEPSDETAMPLNDAQLASVPLNPDGSPRRVTFVGESPPQALQATVSDSNNRFTRIPALQFAQGNQEQATGHRVPALCKRRGKRPWLSA